MSNNININTIISFVESMTYEDIKKIDIPNSTLYTYKQNSRKLYNTKFKNILKIHTYIQRYKTNVVGIDLGSNHYIAASNIDRSITYIDNKNNVYKLFHKYKNRVNHKTYDNVLAYTKLKIGLLNYINQEINEIIKQFEEHKNIFVLGTHNYSDLSFPSLIFDLTYQSIKIRMGTHDEIMLVDESFTSIECPSCMYRAKNNRTKSNHFRCQRCSYYHENDDVVAASNIGKRALNKITK